MAHGTRRNETGKVHNTESYPAYSKAVISSKLFIHVCLPLAVRLRLQYVDKEKQEHGIRAFRCLYDTQPRSCRFDVSENP